MHSLLSYRVIHVCECTLHCTCVYPNSQVTLSACRDQVESQMYIDNKISMVNTYMLVSVPGLALALALALPCHMTSELVPSLGPKLGSPCPI